MDEAAFKIQIRRHGTLTIPATFRRKYRLEEGDTLRMIDLGEGSFLLMPSSTQVSRIGKQIERALEQQGITLEELLSALDQEREQYYRTRYLSK